MIEQELGEMLPLDAKAKKWAREAARLMLPRREEIAGRWADKYLASPIRVRNLDDQQARRMICRLLDLFLDTIKRGDFDAYYRGLVDIGREYAGMGIAYSNLILSVHIYEEVVDPILVEAYTDRRRMLDTLLSLDRLNHNALAVLASTYFRSSLEEIRERNRQLSVVNSVAITVSQTLETTRLLEGALDRIVQDLGFDYAEILLLDESQHRLYPAAFRGISPKFAQELEEFAVGEGLTGIVAESGRSLFISDIENDPRFLRTRAYKQGLKSALGIPLIARKRVVGVMIIYSQTSEPPDENDQQLLNTVGSQIGSAIENATLYRQLQDRAEELAEANRRREQFISLVAHEFRGPLTVIIGYGQMLGRPGAQNQAANQKTAETIVTQAKRLARLVDDLQDVSQIESGRFEMVRERFDLVELAREIVRTQQATTKKHQLVLKAPKQPVEGDWDRDRLAQALVNLLSNAIKYSPDGGPVTLSIEPEDHCVDLTVSDQGIGIARQDFPRLFLPYSKLYREQPIKGTGLGLFITLGIIKAHRGSLWVDSEVGKGTSFHISLPREA